MLWSSHREFIFSLQRQKEKIFSPAHSLYSLHMSQHDCFFLLLFFFSFFLFNLLTFKKSNFNLEVSLTSLFPMTKGECGLWWKIWKTLCTHSWSKHSTKGSLRQSSWGRAKIVKGSHRPKVRKEAKKNKAEMIMFYPSNPLSPYMSLTGWEYLLLPAPCYYNLLLLYY